MYIYICIYIYIYVCIYKIHVSMSNFSELANLTPCCIKHTARVNTTDTILF